MIPTLFLLKFHISQKNALCFKPTSPFCCWFCPETSHLHNQLRLQAKSQVFLHLRIVRRSFVSYPFWSVSIDESVCIRFAIGYDAMNVPMKKIKPKKEADVENPPKKCETANRWRINPILRPDLFGHLVEDVPTKLPFWMSPWSCYKLGDGCWLNHDIHSCTPTRMAKVCCRFSGLHSKNHKYIDFHGGYSTFWFWKTYGWFMWGLGVLEQVHHSHVPQKKNKNWASSPRNVQQKKTGAYLRRHPLPLCSINCLGVPVLFFSATSQFTPTSREERRGILTARRRSRSLEGLGIHSPQQRRGASRLMESNLTLLWEWKCCVT